MIETTHLGKQAGTIRQRKEGLMTKSKVLRTLLPILITLALGGGLYYYAPPALNIHDSSLWWMVILLAAVYGFLRLIARRRTLMADGRPNLKGFLGFAVAAVLALLYLIIGLFTTPLFFSGRYAEAGLERIVIGDFSTEVEMVQNGEITDIAIMDTTTAAAMGKRQIGSLGTLATQYELGQFMTTTVNGQAKKVATMGYGGFWKWLNRRGEGIPGYVSVDPVTGSSEYIEFPEPIHYSDTAYFNENIYRHLQFSAPTAYFGNVHFEVDNEGNPYWIATTYSFRVGLTGCPVPDGVLVCDAVTGKTTRYGAEEAPEWVSIIFPADDLIRLVNYAGLYENGFWNSRMAKTGVYICTDDYGYKVVGENLNAFTGITSAASDESNIGFVLCDEHTGQIRRYDIYGAEEYSAETAAEGLVMNYGYRASFPSLVNVNGSPVYVMALTDDGSLIKKYAMVDLQDYTKVVAADTIQDTWRQFVARYGGSAAEDISYEDDAAEDKTIRLTAPVEIAVLEGNSYAYLKAKDGIYRIPVDGNEEVLFAGDGEEISIIVYGALREGVYAAALEK